MKNILSYITLLVAGMMVFAACKKDTDMKADFVTPEQSAFVRVIHAAPSFRQVFNAPDSFNVFLNTTKVNGAFITYAGQFPLSGTNFGYSAVPVGSQNIRLSVGGVVNPDSIPLMTFTRTFVKGQYYSIIVTDNVKSANDSAKIVLQDIFTKPSNGNYSVRFVHAVLNDTAAKNIDIFSARKNANIYNNIKPGQIVDFQSLPYNSQVSDTLYVRRAGTTFNLYTAAGVSFGNQRVYTMIYRGNGDLTTGTKARTIVTYLHQ